MALISLVTRLSGERRFFGFEQTSNETIRGQAVFSASLRRTDENPSANLSSLPVKRLMGAIVAAPTCPDCRVFIRLFRNPESPNWIIPLKSFRTEMSKFEKRDAENIEVFLPR
jgi:hypothetical protein